MSWSPASDGPIVLGRRRPLEGDRERAELEAGGQARSRSSSVKSPRDLRVAVGDDGRPSSAPRAPGRRARSRTAARCRRSARRCRRRRLACPVAVRSRGSTTPSRPRPAGCRRRRRRARCPRSPTGDSRYFDAARRRRLAGDQRLVRVVVDAGRAEPSAGHGERRCTRRPRPGRALSIQVSGSSSPVAALGRLRSARRRSAVRRPGCRSGRRSARRSRRVVGRASVGLGAVGGGAGGAAGWRRRRSASRSPAGRRGRGASARRAGGRGVGPAAGCGGARRGARAGASRAGDQAEPQLRLTLRPVSTRLAPVLVTGDLDDDDACRPGW